MDSLQLERIKLSDIKLTKEHLDDKHNVTILGNPGVMHSVFFLHPTWVRRNGMHHTCNWMKKRNASHLGY